MFDCFVFFCKLCKDRLLDDFNTLWKRAYFALIILATLISFLTYIVSQAASNAWNLQIWLYSDPTNEYSKWVPSYIYELFIKIFLVVCAVGTISWFQPAAAGSGVPELRAILSGIWIREYLGIRTFLVKIVALAFSLSSGLPIGLEGPFIHLAAILGRQLTKLPFFRHLDRKQVLSAACAGGLASVFGAPIGGVLFSIEVTSTYYAVTNYWTAFCCAVAGSTLTHVFGKLSPTSLLFYETNFSETDDDDYRTYDLLVVAGVGVCCGLIGSIFITGHEGYVNFRRRYQARILGTNPYGIAILVVTLFVSVMFFIGDFAIQPARRAVADMFTVEHLENCTISSAVGYDDCEYHDWANNRTLNVNLTLFCVLNLIFSIMAVTLNYPCGVFAPVFTIGAVFGRLSGELSRDLISDNVDPRVYAVVGAAGVAAGVTQTISPAVIALEITQELDLSVPLLLCVILACGTSASVSVSFYDSILRLRGIPMLPIRPSEPYKLVTIRKRVDPSSPTGDSGNGNNDNNKNKKRRGGTGSFETQTMYRLLIADDVMDKEFSFVTIEPTVEELIEILTDDTHSNEWFPVVHSRSEAVLVGEVRRVVLLDYLRVIAPDIYEEQLSAEMRAEHMVFFQESQQTMRDKASLMDTSLLTSMNIPNTLKTPHHKSKNANNNKWFKLGPPTTQLNENSLQPSITGASNVSQNGMSLPRPDSSDDSDDENNNNNNDSNNNKNNSNGNTNEDDETPGGDVRWTLMSSGFIERLNLSPLQVISEMPLTKIYTLFHILKPQNIYVTKYSRLIGVINELHLLHREIETQNISVKRICCRKYCRGT